MAVYVGNVLEDAWDDVADVATSVVDAISDAGDEIGAALKVIAPIVALVPGWGTALSVALSAAAAWASQDSIGDAVLDVASAAMPGPVSKTAFDSARNITTAALTGGDVAAAAITSARGAAEAVGGKPAVSAFDVGVQVARGQRIGDSAYALARSQIAQSGTVALAAFDAGVAIKNGGDAKDAVLAAARAYLEETGGAAALVAFDVGVGLAQGKALQDAGFAALKNFVAGDSALERAIDFAEKMIRAAKTKKPLVALLEDDLFQDVATFGIGQAASAIDEWIPQWRPEWNDYGVGQLALQLGISELAARALQAIMRTGTPDAALYKRLTYRQSWAHDSTTATSTLFQDVKLANSNFTSTIVAAAPSSQFQTALAANRQQAAASFLAPVAHADAEARVNVVAPTVAPLAVVQSTAAPAPSSRTGVVGDVALGVTVIGACLALVLWARS